MNKEEIPQHIAIIMDGNGRWAKNRNENRIQGHIKAKKSVRESIEFCVEKKIKHLTLFAFSTENWKRPKLEVQALMNLLNNVISDELNTLKNQNIKLKVIGDLSPLPKKTKESLKLAINETSKNKGLSPLKPQLIQVSTILERLHRRTIPNPFDNGLLRGFLINGIQIVAQVVCQDFHH